MTLKEIYQALAEGKDVRLKVIGTENWQPYIPYLHKLDLSMYDFEVCDDLTSKTVIYPNPIPQNDTLLNGHYMVEYIALSCKNMSLKAKSEAHKEGRLFSNKEKAFKYIEALRKL